MENGLTDVEALKGTHYPGGGTVGDAIANAIATIGENMNLRRAAAVHVEEGVIGHYVHNPIAEGLGKIGVLVALESTGKSRGSGAARAAHRFACRGGEPARASMHRVSIRRSLRARRTVLAEKNAGKPPHVLEKIVELGLKTYYKEVTLLEQPSIHAEHGNKTISQVLKEAEGAAGAPVTLKAFVRYALGEGIEKQETDFAAEVAAASGQG